MARWFLRMRLCRQIDELPPLRGLETLTPRYIAKPLLQGSPNLRGTSTNLHAIFSFDSFAFLSSAFFCRRRTWPFQTWICVRLRDAHKTMDHARHRRRAHDHHFKERGSSEVVQPGQRAPAFL